MRFPLQTIDQLKPLVQGFRKRAGLTQAAMAEKLGITQQSYAQMESNLSSTSVERLYTILRLLNVELSFLPSDSATGDRHENPPAGPKKPTRSYTNQPMTVSRRAKRVQAQDSNDLPPGVPQKSAEGATRKPKAKPNSAKPAKVGLHAIKQSDKTKW